MDSSMLSSCLVILDNCLPKSIIKNKYICELILNGRMLHITNIFTISTLIHIPPDLRINFDYIFILQQHDNTNRKNLCEHYAGIFPNYRTFEETLDAMILSNVV